VSYSRHSRLVTSVNNVIRSFYSRSFTCVFRHVNDVNDPKPNCSDLAPKPTCCQKGSTAEQLWRAFLLPARCRKPTSLRTLHAGPAAAGADADLRRASDLFRERSQKCLNDL
jgi:hypothetical protein